MSRLPLLSAAAALLLAAAIFWSPAEPFSLKTLQPRVAAAGYYITANNHPEMMFQSSRRPAGRTNPIPGAMLLLMVGGAALAVYGAIRGSLELAALIIRKVKKAMLRDHTVCEDASLLTGMTPQEKSSIVRLWQIQQDAAAETASQNRDAISRFFTVIILVIYVYRSC